MVHGKRNRGSGQGPNPGQKIKDTGGSNCRKGVAKDSNESNVHETSSVNVPRRGGKPRWPDTSPVETMPPSRHVEPELLASFGLARLANELAMVPPLPRLPGADPTPRALPRSERGKRAKGAQSKNRSESSALSEKPWGWRKAVFAIARAMMRGGVTVADLGANDTDPRDGKSSGNARSKSQVVLDVVRRWMLEKCDWWLEEGREETFAAFWAELSFCWGEIKNPSGKKLREVAADAAFWPLPSQGRKYFNDRAAVLLMRLLMALHKLNRGEPFALACNVAAGFLEVESKTAWRILKVFRVCGIVEEVKTGTPGLMVKDGGRATLWKYVASNAVDVLTWPDGGRVP